MKFILLARKTVQFQKCLMENLLLSFKSNHFPIQNCKPNIWDCFSLRSHAVKILIKNNKKNDITVIGVNFHLQYKISNIFRMEKTVYQRKRPFTPIKMKKKKKEFYKSFEGVHFSKNILHGAWISLVIGQWMLTKNIIPASFC